MDLLFEEDYGGSDAHGCKYKHKTLDLFNEISFLSQTHPFFSNDFFTS